MRAKWRRKKCPWTSFTSNGPGPGPAIELTAAVNVIGERGGPIEKARKNGGLQEEWVEVEAANNVNSTPHSGY